MVRVEGLLLRGDQGNAPVVAGVLARPAQARAPNLDAVAAHIDGMALLVRELEEGVLPPPKVAVHELVHKAVEIYVEVEGVHQDLRKRDLGKVRQVRAEPRRTQVPLRIGHRYVVHLLARLVHVRAARDGAAGRNLRNLEYVLYRPVRGYQGHEIAVVHRQRPREEELRASLLLDVLRIVHRDLARLVLVQVQHKPGEAGGVPRQNDGVTRGDANLPVDGNPRLPVEPQ
mmetsp:Transcript_33714/g.94847  ORF Transcript_33714/g.94847 Transcript_33714/m.94847 type:complete len:229 (-) Transcript_33714:290-976(-)